MSGASSLSGRSASGAIWVAAALGSQQAIQLASKIVLAHILLPAQFGVAGMAAVVMGTLGIFLNLGFASAIVYRRDRIEEVSHTAFWILPWSGVLLTAIGWVLAGPAAAFFDTPEVVPLTRVFSVSLFVSSLSWVSSARIARELAFRRMFYAEAANAVAYGITAIPLALHGHGAMSLAWGWLAGSTAQTIVLSFVSDYRPRFYFDRALARELFAYGGAVMSSNLAAHLVTQADAALVGRMLGSAALGFYALALQAVTLVVNQIVAIVRRVAFPAFAEVQGDRERLRSTAHAVLHLTAALVLPAVFGAAMAGRWLIPAVFGPQWHDAVPLVALLSVMGAAFAIRNVIGSLMHGVGLPKIYQAVPWISVALIVGLGVPAARTLGIAGLAAAVSLSHAVGAGVGIELVHRRLGWPRADFIRPALRPAAATAAMAAVLIPIHLWNPPPVAGSVVCVVLGGGAYAGVLAAIDREGLRRVSRWFASARARSAAARGGAPAPAEG